MSCSTSTHITDEIGVAEKQTALWKCGMSMDLQ